MKFRLFAVTALLLSSLFTYADDCHKMIPVERKISRDYTKNPHRAPESSSLIIVPVPSDGLYMLEITLSNGREYYGTFSTEE